MNAKEELHIYMNYSEDKTNMLNVMQAQQKNPIFETIRQIKNN